MRTTFGSLWQRLQAWTVALMVLIAVSGQSSLGKVQLHFKAPICKYSNVTLELLCDLTNQTQKDAELAESTWDELMTTKIVGANSLLIKPQRGAATKELRVVDCEGVNTMRGADADRVRLHLRESKAGTITNVANLLRAYDSEIQMVDLNPVSQFDFMDCEVGDLAIRATESKCSIVGSEITLMRFVVLEGSFKFEVYGSNITDIQHLHYNSSYMESTIIEARIDNVQESGIVVRRGRISLVNVTIDNLDSGAFRIEDTGMLVVEKSTVAHAAVDSLIMNGGSVQFSQVTIGDQVNVSFVITDASGGLQPFAIVFKRPSVVVGMVVSVVVGLILGVVICGVLYFFLVHRRGSLKSDDREGMELLADSKTKPTTKPIAKPIAKPSHYTPEPQKDNKVEEEEDEEYIDVDVEGAPPPLPNNVSPSLTTDHRPQPKDQAPPQAPPKIVNLQLQKAPMTPPPQPNQRPAGRIPPLPPLRKESVKNNISSPSSSLSEERDNSNGAAPQKAKPQVPPGKPSFLYMKDDSKAPSSPVTRPGSAKGRPAIPSRPAPPPVTQPTEQKSSTFSAEEDDEDIYDTLEEN